MYFVAEIPVSNKFKSTPANAVDLTIVGVYKDLFDAIVGKHTMYLKWHLWHISGLPDGSEQAKEQELKRYEHNFDRVQGLETLNDTYALALLDAGNEFMCYQLGAPKYVVVGVDNLENIR